MNSLHAQTSYLAYVIIILVCIMSLLYSLIRYYKRLNIWTILFSIFLTIDYTLVLFSKTIQEYNICLSLKPAVDISIIISSMLWFITIMKVGLKNAWETKFGRTILIVCGAFLLFSFVALLIFQLFFK